MLVNKFYVNWQVISDLLIGQITLGSWTIPCKENLQKVVNCYSSAYSCLCNLLCRVSTCMHVSGLAAINLESCRMACSMVTFLKAETSRFLSFCSVPLLKEIVSLRVSRWFFTSIRWQVAEFINSWEIFNIETLH